MKMAAVGDFAEPVLGSSESYITKPEINMIAGVCRPN
jgi:hypothetical protein